MDRAGHRVLVKIVFQVDINKSSGLGKTTLFYVRTGQTHNETFENLHKQFPEESDLNHKTKQQEKKNFDKLPNK